jgi:hypothetical protein
MVADAGPSIAEVASVVKCFTAREVALWHRLHVNALVPKMLTWNACSPEL